MAILLLGVNFRTASIAEREQFAFNAEALFALLNDCRDKTVLDEVLILSTCNRTEIIGVTAQEVSATVINWLQQLKPEVALSVGANLYELWNEQAVAHLFKVACGLDSLVLGEPQILGQLKSAYHLAGEAKTLGVILQKLFQQTFAVAKEVRTRTQIGTNPVSVAFVAVNLAKQLFNLKHKNILLIGAGETAELLLQHFSALEVGRILIANRTFSRAEKLAHRYKAEPIALGQIAQALEEADVVATSTASTAPLIDKNMVKQALKKRKHRPLFMIDLAVPRDIQPEVGDLEDVYLYSIDDLNHVVEENKRLRQEAAKEAGKIVEVRAAQLMESLNVVSASFLISQYRESAEMISQKVIEEGLRRLNKGEDSKEVLTRMCHLLVDRLMHSPTLALREAGKEKRQDLLEWARTLFNLPD